ncbi:DUF1350 family protein [Synechocystis sp. B12]|nr:DUF1350 family protein [Synechocystis sp. B12]
MGNSQEFSPLDAVGQWLKSSLSQDLRRLQKEILRWLEPSRFYSNFDSL